VVVLGTANQCWLAACPVRLMFPVQLFFSSDEMNDDDDKENKLTITSIKYLLSSTVIVSHWIAGIAILYRNHNK